LLSVAVALVRHPMLLRVRMVPPHHLTAPRLLVAEAAVTGIVASQVFAPVEAAVQAAGQGVGNRLLLEVPALQVKATQVGLPLAVQLDNLVQVAAVLVGQDKTAYTTPLNLTVHLRVQELQVQLVDHP